MNTAERIEKAKSYKVSGFSGDTKVLKIGVSLETVTKFGYVESDFDEVSKSGETFKLANANCPVVNKDNYQDVAKKVLDKPIWKIVKKAIEAKYGNDVRAILNRETESKSVKNAADFDAARELFEAGEIDAAEFARIAREIATR